MVTTIDFKHWYLLCDMCDKTTFFAFGSSLTEFQLYCRQFLSARCVRVDLLWSRFFIYAISLCQSCAWFCSHFFDSTSWHVCETESQFYLEDGLECWFHVIAFWFQIYWILVSKMKRYFQFSTFEQIHYHTNLRYKGWLVIALYQKYVEILALVVVLPYS